jgi:hypothetical protein
MSAHAFVDETKTSGLLIAAAVLAPRDLARARAQLRALCLPGQSRLHFVKERPSRRRDIATAVCRSGAALDIHDASAIRDQRAAREACLRDLVTVLAADGAHRLVLEQDDSLLENDQVVLYDAVRRAGVTDRLKYEHVPARSESLLWIADAAAWCWTHGPSWRSRIAPAVSARPTALTARSPAHPPSGGLPGSLRAATAARITSVGQPVGSVKEAASGLLNDSVGAWPQPSSYPPRPLAAPRPGHPPNQYWVRVLDM